MPGSHDSGTYGMTIDHCVSEGTDGFGWFVGIGGAISWGTTQKLDLVGQLNAGARFFDIRLCVDQKGTTPRFNHGRYLAGIFGTEEISALVDWLIAHPSEIVVVKLGVTGYPGYSLAGGLQ